MSNDELEHLQYLEEFEKRKIPKNEEDVEFVLYIVIRREVEFEDYLQKKGMTK